MLFSKHASNARFMIMLVNPSGVACVITTCMLMNNPLAVACIMSLTIEITKPSVWEDSDSSHGSVFVLLVTC